MVKELYQEERASAVLSATDYELSCKQVRDSVLDAWQRETERMVMNQVLFTDRYLYAERIADLVEYIAWMRGAD